MAKLVGVFNTAHTPFCYMAPENWEKIRSNRPPYRDGTPVDDAETNAAKAARVQNGFSTLKAKLAEVHPDVLVIFGDDQHEMFDFNNHPSLAIYVGEEFSGFSPNPTNGGMGPKPEGAQQHTVKGHPALATHLLVGLLDKGFDPAFMQENPKPDRGMCHAVMNPLTSLTDFDIPTVPLLCNAYYAPQLTAKRCYEIGLAVRELIDSYPDDLRVAVIGSGGLWHTPGQPQSFIDEEFDRECVEFLEAGDIKGLAAHFDAYQLDPSDASQRYEGRGGTGLPISSGPQGGTRETCNWIGAAACGNGVPETVVDYIPIYASPIGVSFAYSTFE